MAHYGFRNIYSLRLANKLLDENFPGEARPDLLDLERNVSLVLNFGNPHILDGWRPLMPNYVDVGMMNCNSEEDGKQIMLPTKTRQMMENPILR